MDDCARQCLLPATPECDLGVHAQVLEPVRPLATERAHDQMAVHKHGEHGSVVWVAAPAAGRLKDDQPRVRKEIRREAPGPDYGLDYTVYRTKEIGREIRSSRSLGACRRGRSCCRYHSLLPGAGE